VAAFFAEVEKSASAFLDRKSQSLLHGELQFELGRLVADLGSHEDSSPGSVPSIDVRNEWDLSVVRAHAREAVTKLGGKSWDVVKGMTLVSELARNVVLYTKGGRVDFVASTNPRGLTVRVVDQGPGIANLEQVLSGKYRSKTGLGKGLLGAKQLCHRFDIESDATGTRIEAEMRF
jgi:serine/threonine-protein kinase RsbT